MVVLNVTFYMKEGKKAADLLNELESGGFAPYSRTEQGNICYRYFYPADGENILFLLEKWDNADVLKAHMHTENFARMGEVTNKYAENTELKIYNSDGDVPRL